MIIDVKNISKLYGRKAVIKDISFSIHQGEIFGFLGKNGVGKSTLINILTGIIRPTSGAVRFFGEKVSEKHKRVGVLPDCTNYYNDLTAYQHLTFYSSLKGIRIGRKEIHGLLNRVGLEVDNKKKNVSSFSFGMKRKLGIAQALIGDPEILFLDEPTSTLDIESAIRIRELIQSLSDDGKTIFMTSHNLDEVEKICDRIAIMEDGKIKKLGSMSWLRKNAQSNLKVEITSKQNRKDTENYVNKVKKLGIDIVATQKGFSVVIDSDEFIPGLISLAINQNIRIYGVEVENVSLEEIFLSK